MNRIQPISIVTIALITLPYRAVAQPGDGGAGGRPAQSPPRPEHRSDV
jgi:hypothetical protein